MLGVVRDEQRRPVGRIRDTVKLATEAADDLKKKTVQYETGFEMPPGKYHVKIVVRENQDGAFGSYETDIVVPDLKKDALKMSSVVVGTQLQAGARKNDRNPLVRDGRELVPNVTHVVSAGQHLYFYYEVYDPAQPVKVMTSIAFFRGKVRAFETPVVETTELAGSDKKTAVFQFDVPASVAAARPLHLPDQRRRRRRGNALRSRGCSCTSVAEAAADLGALPGFSNVLRPARIRPDEKQNCSERCDPRPCSSALPRARRRRPAPSFEETRGAGTQLRQGGVQALAADRRRHRPGDRRARAGIERRRPRPGGRSGLAGVRRAAQAGAGRRSPDRQAARSGVHRGVRQRVAGQRPGVARRDDGVRHARSKHPELATAPFLLWGMSAGGEFNYEFVCWKPERVVAFVVNKGNIYYTALAPKAARSVPGILFTGGKDLEFRTSTITGLFAVNRRGGALWALAEEPSAAHVVGRSRDVALVLFEDALALRLGDGSALKPLAEKSGFLGDIKAKTFQADRRGARCRTIRPRGCRPRAWPSDGSGS